MPSFDDVRSLSESGPSGLRSAGVGLPSHDVPMQAMEFPTKARVLSANPSLLLSISNIPTKAVKKGLPNTIELSLFESSPT